MATFYTVGHSTLTAEELLALLEPHGVQTVADVRRYPGSRRAPWFNRSEMARWLPEHGVRYEWIGGLGGRRGKPRSPSPWRNPAFAAYAEYAQTPAFEEALAALEQLGEQTVTVILCAEALWWRCHRRIVAAELVRRGHSVQHIMPDGRTQPASSLSAPDASLRKDG